MKQQITDNNIVIYQAPNGAIALLGDADEDTFWATQAQISETFGVDVRTINEHIKNIYTTGELNSLATLRNFRRVQTEGKREVSRDIQHYNLDMIIAVGYRVNSKTATQFRIWATQILKNHITKGYTINREQVGKNYDAFMQSVSDIQALLPAHVVLEPKAILELVREFSSTWLSLDAYDKESLTVVGTTKKEIQFSGAELTDAIANLRQELLRKGEVTTLFAEEREKGSVAGIVGNVLQSFGGEPVYASVEEKAANLLYFMVKNHPFVDGNKRAGAFAFIWFLRKTRLKGGRHINPNALTVLTLLIAESHPEKKEQMVALVTQMLK